MSQDRVGKRIATPDQVLQIRREWDSGTIHVRTWANALQVSPETIRKIGRRDTYREITAVSDIGERHYQPRSPVAEPEPNPDEIAASLAKFRSLAEAATGKTANDLIAELTQQGRPTGEPEA